MNMLKNFKISTNAILISYSFFFIMQFIKKNEIKRNISFNLINTDKHGVMGMEIWKLYVENFCRRFYN